MATKAKTNKRRAAIELDKLKDTPLSELKADTFLEALVAGRAIQYVALWPEKKKYELYIEPENIGKIPFDRFRDILKGEKKKVEYEVPDFLDRYRDGTPQPIVFDRARYERLVDRLAGDIEERLRERMG